MRYLFAVVLALALVFAVSTASLAIAPPIFSPATPFVAAEGGQFELFGGYASGLAPGFTIGAGYGFADGFTLGAIYNYSALFNWFGAYANLTFDPIVLVGNVYFSPMVIGKAGGYFTFDLAPVTLGLGGGAYFGATLTPLFFVGADVSIAVDGNFALYGSVDYVPGSTFVFFEAGLSLGF